MAAAVLLQFIALLLVAALAGMHLSGSAALNPALRSLDATTYVAVKQALDRAFPRFAKPLMLSSLVVTAGVATVAGAAGHRGVAALGTAALVALALTLVATIRGDLPLNRLMATWDPAAPPADLAQIQARWERFFSVRTGATAAALACLAVAALLPR